MDQKYRYEPYSVYEHTSAGPPHHSSSILPHQPTQLSQTCLFSAADLAKQRQIFKIWRQYCCQVRQMSAADSLLACSLHSASSIPPALPICQSCQFLPACMKLPDLFSRSSDPLDPLIVCRNQRRTDGALSTVSERRPEGCLASRAPTRTTDPGTKRRVWACAGPPVAPD